MRERQYLDPFRADKTGCDYQILEKEMCNAEVEVCQGKTYIMLIPVVYMLVHEVLQMFPLTGFLMKQVPLQSGVTGQPAPWCVGLGTWPGQGGSLTG